LTVRERCNTGINELDEMLLGGIPKRRSVLVEGPPGAGKTVLSLHFLTAGILMNPEPQPGILVCLDESPEDLIGEAASFGWDLMKLVDLRQLCIIDAFSGRLGLKSKPAFVYLSRFDINTVIDEIARVQKEIGAQRLVIDPVSALLDELEGRERRKAVLELAGMLGRSSLTTLLNSELDAAGIGVERYVAHGIIQLTYNKTDDKISRRMRIVKMRGTMHSMDLIPYDITGEGIELQV